MKKTSRQSLSKRIMKSGHGLFVPLPSEAVKQWNLKKGDEINVAIEEGAVKIIPKQPTQIETISEDMLAAYSSAVKGIQAKLILDSENQAIHLEFSGEDKKMTNLFAQNLWSNLPVLLRMLGLGSVAETTAVERKRGRRKGSY